LSPALPARDRAAPAAAPAPRRVAAGDPGAVAAAVRVLAAGGVVAYPTEHFYALACDPMNPAAVERLFALKGRASRKPLLLAIADRSALADWAAPVPPDARALAAAWPEGLTLVLPAAPGTPTGLLGGGATVGLRLVRAPVAAALVRAAGGALPATSANPSGRSASGDPDAVARALPDLDLILDAGPLPPGPLSTLLDVTVRPWRVLRAGAVSPADLAAFGPVAEAAG
jgi:L-threonylcarbamoyladenylate synthase